MTDADHLPGKGIIAARSNTHKNPPKPRLEKSFPSKCVPYSEMTIKAVIMIAADSNLAEKNSKN